MKTSELSYKQMKAEVERLGLTLPDQRKETLIAALEAYSDEPQQDEIVVEKAQGRPINPNSARQMRLREMEIRRAKAGELKRGRPVDPNSARQQALTNKGTNVGEDGVPHRGRPVNPESARQKALATKNNVSKIFQVIITAEDGSQVNHTRRFKLAKSAIKEMKDLGYNASQYKIVEQVVTAED